MSHISDDLNIVHVSLEDSHEKVFVETIGFIEQLIVDEEFLQLHNDFMEKYWKEFEEGDENKLVYMDIFKKYVDTIEKYIEKEIRRNIPNFSITEFEEQLKLHENDLDAEIYEILSSFTNFLTFKSLFLEYKAMKEGRTIDLTTDIYISKYTMNG